MSENKMKKAVYNNVYGEEVSFNFNPSPSVSDKVSFVKTVVDTIVDDSYLSIARDMFFDFYLISIFTDVDIKEFYEGKEVSVSTIEELLDETNIAEVVKLNMDNGVIAELETAVDLDIEYRTGIHRNYIEDSIGNLINTFNNKVNDFDTDIMMDVIGKLSSISGEFTPEKMLDAYANADAFKKKIIEQDVTDAEQVK